MKVFLMRHAHAGYGPPDPERPLTGHGRMVAREMAGFAKRSAFFDFHEIWCSPYLRAEETAQPLQEAAKGKLDWLTCDFLTPMADPEILLQKLQRQKQSVIVVGHNPHLSLTARSLMGIESAHLPFKKGGVMAFRNDDSQESGFALAGYLTPSLLGL